jgi:uncharacterized protein (DUF1684 family)
MPPKPSNAYLEEIERWHACRLARLTGPDGWLSLVGLEWLEEGENAVGSDPSNQVVLPAGRAPARVGTVTLEDGVATLAADAGIRLTHDHRPVRRITLRDDLHGEPTVVRLGDLSFHVINRAGRLAVRVKDSTSPVRAGFRGIDRYPVDSRWKIEAGFESFDPPRQIPVSNVLDFEETMVAPGALSFEIGRTACRLVAFREVGSDDLFIVFGDRTNRDDTYQAGRYLYARPPGDAGLVVVDFNKAYNPPCVFTPYATCVLPLPESRLPVRIEAGEKRYRG